MTCVLPGPATCTPTRRSRLDDPVSSTLCLPEDSRSRRASSALGYSSTITETSEKPSNGSHKELGQSTICVAVLGQAAARRHTPANWGTTNEAHQIFRILESALKGQKTITKVFHNGSCEAPSIHCTAVPNANPSFPQGCVVQIIPPSDGSDPKIWTVVANAPTNGPWNW